MPYSDDLSDVIVTRGEEIYQQYREEFESQYKGQFFVVDIETGNSVGFFAYACFAVKYGIIVT